MLTPSIGSPGGKREIPVSNNPPETTDYSEIAEDVLENPVLGKVDLKKRETEASPKDKVTKRVTSTAFKEFQRLNKPSP
jgi:hypothetical protein